MNKKNVIYIGVDAALLNTGWVCVEASPTYKLLNYGTVKTPSNPKVCLGERLRVLHESLEKQFSPSFFLTETNTYEFIIETNYHQIYKSGYAPEYVCACAVVSCFFRGLAKSVFEYNPNQTRGITGNIRAKKDQVKTSVIKYFPDTDLKKLNDHEIDAMAAVICHLITS